MRLALALLLASATFAAGGAPAAVHRGTHTLGALHATPHQLLPPMQLLSVKIEPPVKVTFTALYCLVHCHDNVLILRPPSCS